MGWMEIVDSIALVDPAIDMMQRITEREHRFIIMKEFFTYLPKLTINFGHGFQDFLNPYCMIDKGPR